MKKKWLIFALLSTLCFSAGAVACQDNGDSTPTSVEESGVSVAFAQSVFSLYQYEEAILSCEVIGSDETPVYSTSNSSILTVDRQGVVTALGVGTATVTAKVDGVKATCEVTVKPSPYAPEIVLERNSVSLEKDGTYSMSVACLWNGEELEENIEYSWTYAEGANEIVSATKNADGTVTFTGLAVGATEMYVSATVRGIYVNQLVSFEVFEKELVLQSNSTAITPTAGGYSASVATANIAGNSNELALDFLVCKGNEVINNAEIVWESTDASKLTVQEKDGKWYAVGVGGGQVDIVGGCTVNGESVSVTVSVDVYLPDVRLEQTAVIEVENLKTLTLEEEIIGKLNSVYLGDKKVSLACAGKVIRFDKGALPKLAKELGERELTILTDVVRYTMSVEMYTLIIRDKKGLDDMSAIAEANGELPYEFEGYFILGNDIDYNGVYVSMTDSGYQYKNPDDGWRNMTKGFKGIFDGRGYNIDGMEIADRTTTGNESGGMFGYLGSGGIVRNVSFTNAAVQENSGFICSFGNGLIENVSITFTKMGIGLETRNLDAASLPRCMGAFFTSQSGSGATVRNCFVDASNAEILLVRSTVTGNSNVRLVGNTDTKKNGLVKMENVVAVCADGEILVDSGADTQVSNFNELSTNPSIAEGFTGDVWASVNGIPMFKRLAQKLDTTKEIEFTKYKSVVYAGTEIDLAVNEYYASILAGNLPEGIVYADGKLTIGENVAAGAFEVTAVSALNGSRATIEIVVKTISTIQPTLERITIEKDNGSIDLTSALSYLGSTTTVYFGETEIGVGTGVNIAIDWKAITEYGETTLTIITETDDGGVKFDLPVFAVSKVIKTLQDFVDHISKANKSNNFNGYYILGNDIDCSGYVFEGVATTGGQAWDNNYGFRGTFDGNGKKFYNLTVGGYKDGNNGGMFGMIGKGGVIKNVTFDVTYKASYAATLFGGSILDAELMDVTINVIGYEHKDITDTTPRKTENVNRKNSLLASSYINNTKFTNLTINAANFDIYSLITIRSTNCTYVNSTITVKSYHFIATNMDINDTSEHVDWTAETYSDGLTINGEYVPVTFA